MKEHALKVLRQPPERLNCAQSVLHGWREVTGDTSISLADLKPFGGGRAKLAQKIQVEGIPMLVFLQNGKTAGTSFGLAAKENLILRLNGLLTTNSRSAGR